MRTWDLFHHPAYGTFAVKQGFSWPAFFFGWIWVSIKRLWAVLAVLLVTLFCAGGVSGALILKYPPAALLWNWIILSGVNTFLGFKGNQFWRRSLTKRGFTRLNTVQA